MCVLMPANLYAHDDLMSHGLACDP
jgi:hypothetical protein